MALNTFIENSISVRPIEPDDLDCIPLDCWPQRRETVERLFAEQGTLGMGAWEGDRCIAQLHCYRVTLPDWSDRNFPEWAQDRFLRWPLGWPLQRAQALNLRVDGPVWGHACFHVGRLRAETGESLPPDARYFGHGIATALCRESVRWAREHGYAAVLALGGSQELFDYAVWFGVLPWTTYARQGFQTIALEEDGIRLPEWAQGQSPLDVQGQVYAALAVGNHVEDLCGRLMLLDLTQG